MYYDDDGAGLPDRQYCVVDLSKGNQVVFRKKSLVGSIFHELTHALHWISGTWSNEISNTLWQSKEERYTISGIRKSHDLDIICDYGFEKYNSIMPINLALGRDGQFRPRLGHKRFSRVDDKTPPNIHLNMLNKTLSDVERAGNNIVRFITYGNYLWNNNLKHLLFCSTLACCSLCSASFGTMAISQEFRDMCNRARPYATTFESVESLEFKEAFDYFCSFESNLDNIEYSGQIVMLLKTVLDVLKKSQEEYEPRWDELLSRHEGDTSDQSMAEILGSLNCMYILAIVQSREKLAKETKSKFFDLIQKDEYQDYTATFYSDSGDPVTYAQIRKNLEKEDKHGIRWAYFDEDGPLCAFYPDNFATAQELHTKYGRKRVMSD